MKPDFVRAVAADAATVLALEAKVAVPRLYAPMRTVAEAEAEIAGNDFFLIISNGLAIGTAAYRRRDGNVAYIGNIDVDPAWHRRGVARAAMVFMLRANADAARIELVTHPENAPAIALYRSLGFVSVEQRENYWGDGEPRLVMSRSPS